MTPRVNLPARTFPRPRFPQKGLFDMPELIRSVVSRVRVYFKDRRQSPRLRARLLLSISIAGKAKTKGVPASARTLKGHTRDISVRGLAMMLPQVHLSGHHVAAEGRELNVVLELPSGVMSLVVLPRRYEKMDQAELGCNYLIGARIVQIADEDRVRLESFIAAGLNKNSSAPESDIM
jgi:c-di-GMP-binding flagellar brake protein YcgR